MSAETTLVLQLAILTAMCLGLEHVQRKNPKALADFAFEVRYIVALPFLFVLFSLLVWAGAFDES